MVRAQRGHRYSWTLNARQLYHSEAMSSRMPRQDSCMKPIGALVLSLPDFAAALRSGALPKYRGMSGTQCPYCRTFNESGVYVTYRLKYYCLRCVPSTRKCAGCGKRKSVAEFDTYSARLASRCGYCRRDYEREYYHVAKRKPRVIAGRERCMQCKRNYPASYFTIDRRYKSGLFPRCRRCRGNVGLSPPRT